MLHSLTLPVNEYPLFFRLGFKIFTILPILHQTMEASRILQGYIKPPPSPTSQSQLSLLPQSLHPSLLLLLPTHQPFHYLRWRNLSNCVICLFLSSCGVPSHVAFPPRCLFLPVHVVLPNFFTSLHLLLLA